MLLETLGLMASVPMTLHAVPLISLFIFFFLMFCSCGWQEQYAYIHDVLRDACFCGITEATSKELGSRLLTVSNTDPETLRQRNDEFDVSKHDFQKWRQVTTANIGGLVTYHGNKASKALHRKTPQGSHVW